jgi:cyclopropane-fatty-acyl-phospholipid synthase
MNNRPLTVADVPARSAFETCDPNDLGRTDNLATTTFRCGSFERALLRRLLRASGLRDVTFVIGGTEKLSTGSTPSSHVVSIRTKSALWKLLRNPEQGFLDGYVNGAIEVSGDLIELLNQAKRHYSLRAAPPVSLRSAVQAFWRRRQARRSRDNVLHHYDLGNEFYRLWLDEQLVYTCAYFDDDCSRTLEQAQVAKLDYVCRKLRLHEGETVFEAGCGWGALALHMAGRYGVRVRAFNLSDEQLEHARDRARREHFHSRIEFVKADWREISGRCDAFASVGMLEHVGPESYRLLGNVIRKTLGGHGRGLIHSIGQNTKEPLCPWIERNIFPGAQPPTLQQMMDLFGPTNMAVLDVENLRPHYARTLRHWLARFDDHADRVREMFGERFVRLWRIYLASSASAFEIGSLQLYQVLFAPIGSPFFPMTRASLYRPLE